MAISRGKPAKRKMKPASRPKRARPRARRINTGLILAMVLVAFVAYIWTRDNLLPHLVQTYVAEPGHIERSVASEAVIIRQETVFAAPVSGKLLLRVKEGERVRAGVPVIELSNPRASKVIDEQIAQVDQRLIEFDRTNGQKVSGLEKTNRELNTRIVETLSEARRALAFGDWARLDAVDTMLREAMVGRAVAAVDLERLDLMRNDIIGERQRLAEISKRAQNIVEAPSPGIVSFVIDGLERTFSAVRPEEISARAVFTAKSEPTEARDGDEIKAGQPLFRVVSPDQVFLALPLSSKDLGDVVASQTLRVRSGSFGDKLLSVRVVSVVDPTPDGFGVAVVSLSPCPDEALRLRKVNVELVKARQEGLLIPSKCLVERDGETGVFVVYKTMAQFRKVIVRAQDHGDSIIEGLSPGTEVIINNWLVREGMKVRS